MLSSRWPFLVDGVVVERFKLIGDDSVGHDSQRDDSQRQNSQP